MLPHYHQSGYGSRERSLNQKEQGTVGKLGQFTPYTEQAFLWLLIAFHSPTPGNLRIWTQPWHWNRLKRGQVLKTMTWKLLDLSASCNKVRCVQNRLHWALRLTCLSWTLAKPFRRLDEFKFVSTVRGLNPSLNFREVLICVFFCCEWSGDSEY